MGLKMKRKMATVNDPIVRNKIKENRKIFVKIDKIKTHILYCQLEVINSSQVN
jgi:hypothetical protein